MKNYKSILDDIKKRGYVFNKIDNTFYPPGHEKAILIIPKKVQLKRNITGDIYDSRNSKCLDKCDQFTMLIKKEFNLIVWPEFHFSIERKYRFDYAIPESMIAIEVQGGIWSRGNSGHSSGTGIKRDMEKSRLAQSLGWKVIQCTPDELMTNEIIDLIRTFICIKIVTKT